jgi:hypothetical protein
MKHIIAILPALIIALGLCGAAWIYAAATRYGPACATKRFPLSRCASAIQMVRSQESTAETQPQLQPALLRLSLIISQYFMPCCASFALLPIATNQAIAGARLH